MITMTEIARLTGVSQPTVSRVLNGNTAVNPEIRERVLACAREHDFQPNVMAQSLVEEQDPPDRCDRDRHFQLFFCGVGKIHRRRSKKGWLQSDSLQL